MELYKSHYDKYKEEWTKMKLEFKQQTENVDMSSDENYQFHRDHNEKLHLLKTEFKRKLEKAKEHYMEVSKESRECCICSNKLCDDAYPPLLCGHDEFCKNCMNTWLKNEKTCPICRADCRMPEACKFKNIMLPDTSETYCSCYIQIRRYKSANFLQL